ncbi:hypothetical protein LTR51_000975 [Lithohypha guttulata]|uniref:Nucleoside phosphorylase domain-containing protein n=1 Tax=Lithohypha guttulata TaxID=1690604 RepID=A0ABR0JX62_9EURO|nr:hypothetical protein LTR24_009684 [Lithohypha guttulata]KAK5078784.1 hypothetical protein LTR51_000975 [Lithohypha guttulata]KAK5310045.1 hypothetical protein LTR70_009779 [Exophiala xenobiotica]
MASAPPPRDRGDFEIAVTCALSLEAKCVYDALDKIWDDKKYGKAPNDDNAYTLGVISEHHVVLVHMPGMGTIRAAYAAGHLKMSFPHIKLALVVGICGGMPRGTSNEEIVLGNVVISKALIRYDFGKQYPHGVQEEDGRAGHSRSTDQIGDQTAPARHAKQYRHLSPRPPAEVVANQTSQYRERHPLPLVLYPTSTTHLLRAMSVGTVTGCVRPP